LAHYSVVWLVVLLICVMTHAEQPMPDKPAFTVHPLTILDDILIYTMMKIANFPIQQHLSYIYLGSFACLSSVRQSVVAVAVCSLQLHLDMEGLDLEMEEFERQRLEGECVKKLFIV
jgi:hypothetical protein